MTTGNNVTNIQDAVPSSPLGVIVRRRNEIKARKNELRQIVDNGQAEINALYKEDQELERVEVTVRKLLEKKS